MTDDDRAAGNLRSALWRLRMAGPGALEVDVTSLRLLHAFAALSRALLADGRWAEATEAAAPHAASPLHLKCTSVAR